jgi:hypothetical protein
MMAFFRFLSIAVWFWSFLRLVDHWFPRPIKWAGLGHCAGLSKSTLETYRRIADDLVADMEEAFGDDLRKPLFPPEWGCGGIVMIEGEYHRILDYDVAKRTLKLHRMRDGELSSLSELDYHAKAGKLATSKRTILAEGRMNGRPDVKWRQYKTEDGAYGVEWDPEITVNNGDTLKIQWTCSIGDETWTPAEVRFVPKPDPPADPLVGTFTAECVAPDGNVKWRQTATNKIAADGFNAMLDVDFTKQPPPTFYWPGPEHFETRTLKEQIDDAMREAGIKPDMLDDVTYRRGGY